MRIKAIKFCENGYMTQGFAFGEEEGAEKLRIYQKISIAKM